MWLLHATKWPKKKKKKKKKKKERKKKNKLSSKMLLDNFYLKIAWTCNYTSINNYLVHLSLLVKLFMKHKSTICTFSSCVLVIEVSQQRFVTKSGISIYLMSPPIGARTKSCFTYFSVLSSFFLLHSLIKPLVMLYGRFVHQ